jgi:hypothetical protein
MLFFFNYSFYNNFVLTEATTQWNNGQKREKLIKTN